jgi:hypothetical protein
MPAAEPLEELSPLNVIDDDPPAGERDTPRPAKKKKKKQSGGKKSKKAAAPLRGLPLPAIIGGSVGLVVLVVVLVLLFRGGGGFGGLGSTGAVVSSPVPPLPPLPRPAPVALTKQPLAVMTLQVAAKPASWAAKPDPSAAPPVALAAFADTIKGDFVFASLGGPFFVQTEGPAAKSKLPQTVIDLRTGEKAGTFGPHVSTWQCGRLSPDGQFVVGPDPAPKNEATKKDGQLFVWKQGTDEPVAKLAVGAGAVLWADFVAPNKFAAAVFEETLWNVPKTLRFESKGRKAMLRVWDVTSGAAVHTVALEPGDLAARHDIHPVQKPVIECNEYEMVIGNTAEMHTKLFYVPAEWLGAVSPGGRYLALGGKAGITVVSLAEGKVVGRLPLREPCGRLDYRCFGYSADGATLYALVWAHHFPRGYGPGAYKRQVLIAWSMADGAPQREVLVDVGGAYGVLRPGPMPGTLVVPKWRAAGPPIPSLDVLGRSAAPDGGGAVIVTSCAATLWKFPGVVQRFTADGTAHVVGKWHHAPEAVRPKGANLDAQGIYTLKADAAFLQAKASKELATAGARPAPLPTDRMAVRTVEAVAGPWAVPAPAEFKPAALAAEARLPRWPDAWSDSHAAFINCTRRTTDVRAWFEMAWDRYDLATGQPLGTRAVLWPWYDPDPGVEPIREEILAALTPDGELLALRDPGDPPRVDVWDTTGKRLAGFVPDPATAIEWFGFSDADTLLTLAGGKVTGWQWRTAKALFEVAGGYEGACHFPPGRAWVAAPAAAHVDFLDTKSGALLGRCTAADGTTVWHHTSLSPDGKLLLRTTGGEQADKNNLPNAAFVLWDLTTGKELPTIHTTVAPAIHNHWCSPRRFLTIHAYQAPAPGGGWKTFSHALVDVDAGAVVVSYGPPKGYKGPNVDHNSMDPLAGDPAGRVWVNIGGGAASPPGRRANLLAGRGGRAGLLGPSSAGGTWRLTAFPTSGPDTVLGQGGADVYSFRPGITVRAEVDLGDRGQSQKAAETLAARLARAGYVIGPDAWALRVRATRVDGSQKLTSGPADTGGTPIPEAKLAWELLAPGGAVAWSGTTETKWIFGGSKYQSGRKSASIPGDWKSHVIVTNFDFGGRSAGSAIWEEILERIGAEIGPPPAMPRALLGADGQAVALPLQAEFTVPGN